MVYPTPCSCVSQPPAPQSRFIVLAPPPMVLLGRVFAPPPPTWPPKDPAEIADYVADFSALSGGRFAVQVEYSVAPLGAVTVAFGRIEGQSARFRLTGGTDGQLAQISIILVLDDGEQLAAVITLPIVAGLAGLTPPAAMPGAITLNGFPVTIGGQPVTLST